MVIWVARRRPRDLLRLRVQTLCVVTVDPFVMEQQARPRHCDAHGMVHAARYHDFCEDAFLGWLEQIGTPYPTLRADGADLVIYESRYCYRRPARLDDRLRVAVTGDLASESTLTARSEVRRDEDVLATAEITYVAVHGGHRCALPAVLQRRASQRSAKAEPLLDALHQAQAALYSHGDATGVEQLLDPDIVWRVPGNNQIAGTYRGVDGVLAYMRRRRELAGATFRMHRREVLVGPSHFAALTDGTVERDGIIHRWSTIGLYQARDGRISECSLIPLDAPAFDAAWS
jgi:YbgC/YbaW family acyl-CoA thioester hydrolase